MGILVLCENNEFATRCKNLFSCVPYFNEETDVVIADQSALPAIKQIKIQNENTQILLYTNNSVDDETTKLVSGNY